MAVDVINPTSNPATILVDRNEGGHHYNRGISDKDAVFFSTQAVKDADIHGADRTRALLDEILELDVHNSERTGLLNKSISTASEEINVAIEKNGRAAELATEKTGAATQLSMAVGFASVQLEASKNAAAAALASATTTAAIRADLAACCCEIKETIRNDGGLTRTLINDLNTTSLERQLSDAKNALAGQQQSQGIINALLDKLIK